MPIGDELRNAIELLHRLTHNEAVRRTKSNTSANSCAAKIQTQSKRLLTILPKNKTAKRCMLKGIERWRDNLIAGDASVAESFIDTFPNCDRQQLRQLIKGAKSEFGRPKPPTLPANRYLPFAGYYYGGT